jgi:hypothetical protein
MILHHLLLAASDCSTGLFPGGPGLYDGLKCVGSNPQISALTDIVTIIANVVRILLTLAGALGVIFLIVGGIMYVVSAGDQGQLKRAKDIITNVITGLVVIFVAYGVVTFIAGNLG